MQKEQWQTMSAEDKDTIFIKACRSADYALMAEALKYGANIDAPNIKDATPLMSAVGAKNEDLCLWLIDRGADPTKKTNQGECPLIRAAGNGMVLALKAMVKKMPKEALNVQNNVGATALMEACSNFNVDAVKILVEAGVDVNVRSIQGTNALLIASSRLDYETVEVLLKKGKADPNSVDFYGVPALLGASLDLSKMERTHPKSNSLKTVQVLLNYGANPNLEAKSGNTALVEAATSWNRPVMLELLKHGANPNKCSSAGVRGEHSPLMIAAVHHDIELMELLFSKGADANFTNSKGERALGFALYRLNPDETKVPKNKEEAKEIEEEAKKKALKAIAYLLDKGALMGPKQKMGIAHFAVAIESDDLLEKAAALGQLDAQDEQEHTALHFAFYKKKLSMIEKLLTLGADPNAQDERGRTPGHLYYADPGIPVETLQLIQMHKTVNDPKHKEYVQKVEEASILVAKKIESALLNSAMDVNIQDGDGNSVAMTAFTSYANGRLSAEELQGVIDRGADLTLRNEKLDSLYTQAVRIGDEKFIENWSQRLKQEGKEAEIESVIYDLAWNVSDHSEALKLFQKGLSCVVPLGAKVDYQDEDGQTPLIVATVENKEELVTMLLDAGARIDLPNNEGETALIQAIAQNRPNISKILIQRGADIEHTSNDGQEVVAYAYKYQRTSIINQIAEARQQRMQAKKSVFGL